TRSSPVPAGRPTASAHACSNWSSKAAWRACRADCSSASKGREATVEAFRGMGVRIGVRPHFQHSAKVARPYENLGISLGYSRFTMFDVLVYLYENYWRPDACPDHQQLTLKLSAVGFESDEIREALTWLDGLAVTADGYHGEQAPQSVRLYTEAEHELLG